MYRKQKIRIGNLLLLLLGFTQAFAGNSIGTSEADWCLAKKRKDISLFYRWVELENNNETREMKAEFTIDAEIPDIISQFSSEKSYMQWAAGIKKCAIKAYTDSLWYTHTVMNYPFPFRKKDLVTKYRVKQNEKTTSVFIEAVPEFIAETNKIERIKNYRGTWQFTKNEDGTTSVDYRVLSYEKPVLPRAIQDPVIQRISINSFEQLKKLVEQK